jgi:hypothetical protein
MERAETRLTVELMEDIACPACGPNATSLHADGNHKLFTRDRDYENSRPCYFETWSDDSGVGTASCPQTKALFFDDQYVMEHIAVIDKATGCKKWVSNY